MLRNILFSFDPHLFIFMLIHIYTYIFLLSFIYLLQSEITDACRSQYSGLLITLMIVSSKTIIITLGMASLYFYSKRKMIRYKNLRAVS